MSSSSFGMWLTVSNEDNDVANEDIYVNWRQCENNSDSRTQFALCSRFTHSLIAFHCLLVNNYINLNKNMSAFRSKAFRFQALSAFYAFCTAAFELFNHEVEKCFRSRMQSVGARLWFVVNSRWRLPLHLSLSMVDQAFRTDSRR